MRELSSALLTLSLECTPLLASMLTIHPFSGEVALAGSLA